MLSVKVLLLLLISAGKANENEKPVLYYYGIEESERGLPLCGERQACSALVERYWRPPALVRLCRCGLGLRSRCDLPAPREYTLEINNRAYAQFCQPTSDWRMCEFNEAALNVATVYDRMNPDDLEAMHHRDIGMVPPVIQAHCKCPTPNYWKYNSTLDNVKVFQCSSLPVCNTGEFCGNVNYDLNALYQSCLCPKHHMCVHSGGVTNRQISEILYNGLGWKAYCQRISDQYDEDYY